MALTPFLGASGGDIFNTMDRMMDRMMSGRDAGLPTIATAAFPGFTSTSLAQLHPMDIIERPSEFLLRCDAPGMDVGDIAVEVHEGVLTMSGRKEMAKEDKDKEGRVVRKERNWTSFTRSFTLPEGADADRISASLEKGVLTVSVPKVEVEKPAPKKIAIQAA